MVHELDTVVITRDLPECGLVAGDIGVVAHLYADTRGVEVEFVSGAGRDAASRRSLLAHASGEGATIAVETLSVADVRPVGAREILHARPLGSTTTIP
jgi:hypothetical protein